MTLIWTKGGSDWSLLAPVGFPDEQALHSLVEQSPPGSAAVGVFPWSSIRVSSSARLTWTTCGLTSSRRPRGRPARASRRLSGSDLGGDAADLLVELQGRGAGRVGGEEEDPDLVHGVLDQGSRSRIEFASETGDLGRGPQLALELIRVSQHVVRAAAVPPLLLSVSLSRHRGVGLPPVARTDRGFRPAGSPFDTRGSSSAVGDHSSRRFLNGARRLHFFQR
jgi:hypothetical protein